MLFKDLSDETLQRLGERIIRNAQNRIMRQVPQRGQNPYATGKLKNSVTFAWVKDSETGGWSLQVNYANYGNYTNYGTRRYSAGWRDARDAGFFGREFQGYRRGTKGIRPQNWLSLRGDRPIYEAIVEGEIQKTFETFLNNTISGFGRANRS